MSEKTIYTLYRFAGFNKLVFADDKRFYNSQNLKEFNIRYKNGVNGIYIDRKFISLKKLRENSYSHRELLKEEVKFSDCPF